MPSRHLLLFFLRELRLRWSLRRALDDAEDEQERNQYGGTQRDDGDADAQKYTHDEIVPQRKLGEVGQKIFVHATRRDLVNHQRHAAEENRGSQKLSLEACKEEEAVKERAEDKADPVFEGIANRFPEVVKAKARALLKSALAPCAHLFVEVAQLAAKRAEPDVDAHTFGTIGAERVVASAANVFRVGVRMVVTNGAAQCLYPCVSISLKSVGLFVRGRKVFFCDEFFASGQRAEFRLGQWGRGVGQRGGSSRRSSGFDAV